MHAKGNSTWLLDLDSTKDSFSHENTFQPGASWPVWEKIKILLDQMGAEETVTNPLSEF